MKWNEFVAPIKIFCGFFFLCRTWPVGGVRIAAPIILPLHEARKSSGYALPIVICTTFLKIGQFWAETEICVIEAEELLFFFNYAQGHGPRTLYLMIGFRPDLS